MTYGEKADSLFVRHRDITVIPKHTFGHVDCPACDATEKDAMGFDPDSLSSLRFSAAARKWLESRRPYLKERTFYMYGHHIDQMEKFFGDLLIHKIHLGHLREYQAERTKNAGDKWERCAGPSIINHEMSVLQQILKRAGCWKRIGLHYEPLPLPSFTPKKVMTDEEEERLFDIASRSPEFELAYLVASLSVNTTACGTELRHIRLEHIDLDAKPPRFMVEAEHAKNGYRGRMIPLNPAARDAMAQCIKRAHSLGSVLPGHHLFPKRIKKGKWNPDKPASASWLANSFTAMREAAGLPWLTPHMMRHQAITRMLEFGAPPETVRNIAGHVSEQMMRHYSHTRIKASSAVLDAIDPGRRRRDTRYRPVDRLGTRRAIYR